MLHRFEPQDTMITAQPEERDNDIRTEPEVYRSALPAPVSYWGLKAPTSSNESHTTHSGIVPPPPPPYSLGKPRAAAAANTGGGVGESADAGVDGAGVRLEKDDLLRCCATTAVSLPWYNDEDGNGKEDEEEDCGQKRGGERDGAHLVLQPTAGRATAVAAEPTAAAVAAEAAVPAEARAAAVDATAASGAAAEAAAAGAAAARAAAAEAAAGAEGKREETPNGPPIDAALQGVIAVLLLLGAFLLLAGIIAGLRFILQLAIG